MKETQPANCPHCGASMKENKHGLSKGLARALYLIAKNLDENNEYHVAKCGMTYSQRENSQKLQYWGISEMVDKDKPRGGRWRLTAVGLDFISGNTRLHKFVWTYRGERVRFEGKRLYILELTDGWRYRPDYARDAKPRELPGQGDLL